MAEITVTVSGPVGSGKSAVLGEIELTCKALGIPVRYTDPASAQSEKNMTHGDWTAALEMYKPSVVLAEAAPAAPVQGPLTAEEVLRAMQFWWDDWVNDTGCFPSDFRWEGGNGKLFFEAGAWARNVADTLMLQQAHHGYRAAPGEELYAQGQALATPAPERYCPPDYKECFFPCCSCGPDGYPAPGEEQREAELDALLALFEKCSEERYQRMKASQQEAEKWKAEGDMYGWNYHQGTAGGMNEADIIYCRLQRGIAALRRGRV